MTVLDVDNAKLSSFGRDAIRVRAWLDHGPTIGWLPPSIAPRWLAYPSSFPPGGQHAWALWSDPTGHDEVICIESHCPFVWPHQAPDSTLDVLGPARWVIAVGHLDDPAADRCHWEYLPDQEPIYEDDQAVSDCRHSFVLDAIEEIS